MRRQSVDEELPLYATDEEIARRLLGADAPLWFEVVGEFETAGLPKSRLELGNRRHLPSVLEFLERFEQQEWRFDRGYRRDRFPDDGPESFR